jgi:phosphoribosylformylglycinamidine cyclo-ligase
MSQVTDSKYAQAGVSIAEGDRAVQLMKDAVKATYTPAVLAGIGAFGGMIDVSSLKAMAQPYWWLLLMVWVPKP